MTLAWLAEHPKVAALGLVPDAVGPKGEARSDAEGALLALARRGLHQEVRTAAARYGNAAASVIDALLARDPLAAEATPPKRPDFLRLAELPSVTLRSGGALDEDAADALVEMLQFTSLDAPYAGLALVRESCEPESLGALAVELIEQYGSLATRRVATNGLLHAVVHFPTQAGERRVASLAREWARKSLEKAKRACTALAALGTDFALMHLAHIADTTRFDALQTHARALVAEAAEARELTIDELGDRTVPDLGLAPDGTLSLSYGERNFVVALDEALRPTVREVAASAGAAASRSLPRPAKNDDPRSPSARGSASIS